VGGLLTEGDSAGTWQVQPTSLTLYRQVFPPEQYNTLTLNFIPFINFRRLSNLPIWVLSIRVLLMVLLCSGGVSKVDYWLPGQVIVSSPLDPVFVSFPASIEMEVNYPLNIIL